MPKPFDATSKSLVESHPASWLALIGRDRGEPVEVIDADLATVSTEADKVLRVGGPVPWIAHFELQAGRDAGLVRRMLRYNVLLDVRHDLPVLSVAVLFRPRADGPELTGLLERRPPSPGGGLRFEYAVVRVWELPVDVILAGGLGVLPLAPLADVSAERLADVLRRMAERLLAEADPQRRANVWASTKTLSGLRYPNEVAYPLIERISDMDFLGVHGIEESVSYQQMVAEAADRAEARGLAKGLAEEARRLLVRIATRRFGEPDAAALAAIGAIDDRERLEALVDRVLEVADWPSLLAPESA